MVKMELISTRRTRYGSLFLVSLLGSYEAIYRPSRAFGKLRMRLETGHP